MRRSERELYPRKEAKTRRHKRSRISRPIVIKIIVRNFVSSRRASGSFLMKRFVCVPFIGNACAGFSTERAAAKKKKKKKKKRTARKPTPTAALVASLVPTVRILYYIALHKAYMISFFSLLVCSSFSPNDLDDPYLVHLSRVPGRRFLKEAYRSSSGCLAPLSDVENWIGRNFFMVS